MDSFAATQREAKTAGQKFYFTGKACLRGHVSARYTATFQCVQCHKEAYISNRAERLSYQNTQARMASRLAYRQRTRADRARKMKAKRDARPELRIHHRISSALCAQLKRGKNWRPTAELVGYNASELAAHLERQFVKGMGWHNMGEWHIDHIIPLASFNISSTDDPEFRRAWAITNLRPLWAADNLRKGARVEVLL